MYDIDLFFKPKYGRAHQPKLLKWKEKKSNKGEGEMSNNGNKNGQER